MSTGLFPVTSVADKAVLKSASEKVLCANNLWNVVVGLASSLRRHQTVRRPGGSGGRRAAQREMLQLSRFVKRAPYRSRQRAFKCVNILCL